MKALPKSLTKQRVVLSELLTAFSNKNPVPLEPYSITHSGGRTTLQADIIEKVHDFYERDDISRMSPNVADSRKFLNQNTGKKEVKQVRHMMFRLSEAYALFIEDMTKNGNNCD